MIENKSRKDARRNPRVLFVGAALVFFATAAPAGTHPDPLSDSHRRALLDAFLAGSPDAADLGEGGGVTAQTLAMLGREDLVMHLPIFRGHGRPNCDPMQEDGRPVDPVGYIATKAAGVRVTMINEAHDMPQTRSFAAKIAAALRSKGYSLYAGETFYGGIGATAPAWPLITDGYFVSDPIYGRLIRSLRALGYRLFSYEDYGPDDRQSTPQERMAQREVVQAQNLESHLKTAPVSAKLLVHVGYAHLNKLANMPIKMMAAHFRDDTTIDPLTVDQTMFWSRTGRYEICDVLRMHLADPSVIYVGMPIPSFTRNRPNWRLREGDKLVEIPDAIRRPEAPTIYEAYLASEPDMAVPVDRILVRPGEDNLPLLLPPGRYRVAAWTEKSGWSADVPVTVP
jgi:hypothetical protein